MLRTLNILKCEHCNMRRLLTLLERQAYCVQRTGTADLIFISALTDYFRSYSDMCHHPKEVIIYELLKKRKPELANRISDLSKQHSDSEQKLHAYAHTVVEYFLHPEETKSSFIKTTKDLIEYERTHLCLEETYFFPAATEHLTQKDWDMVHKKISIFREPILNYTALPRLHS